MYVQYAPALPGIAVDEARGKAFFDTSADLSGALEAFYESVLGEDVEAFALRNDYAQGFFALLDALRARAARAGSQIPPEQSWIKGQVTGPISFGLTVTDQDLRASLYNDLLVDPIIKNAALNARWQIRRLKSARPNVIIFVDEPYMASFGSAFISLSREQVIAYLGEVFEAIHAEGALAGVHCCANTDWGLLLSTQVDILNLDAYGFLENLALYPAKLRGFLDRGGVVCWGIVPNNEQVFSENAQSLAGRLQEGIRLISGKAAARGVNIKPGDFADRSLISPACGLGSASVEISDRVLDLLAETARILRTG
jgi:hypothetical protein